MAMPWAQMTENDSVHPMEKHLEMMMEMSSVHPMVSLSAMSLVCS